MKGEKTVKFLVLVTPRADAPVSQDWLTLYQAAKAWIESRLKSGQLDCIYQRLEGRGVAIVNVNTAEELWEGIASYPLTAQCEWQVEPLFDVGYVFNRAIEMLKKASE